MALQEQVLELTQVWQEDRLGRLEASQDAVTLEAQVKMLR